jgi:hypothetical protein
VAAGDVAAGDVAAGDVAAGDVSAVLMVICASRRWPHSRSSSRRHPTAAAGRPCSSYATERPSQATSVASDASPGRALSRAVRKRAAAERMVAWRSPWRSRSRGPAVGRSSDSSVARAHPATGMFTPANSCAPSSASAHGASPAATRESNSAQAARVDAADVASSSQSRSARANLLCGYAAARRCTSEAADTPSYSVRRSSTTVSSSRASHDIMHAANAASASIELSVRTAARNGPGGPCTAASSMRPCSAGGSSGRSRMAER